MSQALFLGQVSSAIKGIALMSSEFRVLWGVRCPVPQRMCSEDSMVKRQADLRSSGV